MTVWAGVIGACAAAATLAGAAQPASAQELSEKSVRSFMDYAWSLTPQQFSKQDGTVIVIDKKKKDEVMVPMDVAREVIRVGRLSAHAQICNLSDHQIINHRSLMKREEDKKTWTDQQLVYINQLHLTTVMLLTGRIRVVEKEGDKEVVVDDGKAAQKTCTEEERTKVRDTIIAYVEAGPNFKVNVAPVAGAPAAPGAKGSAATPAAAAAAPAAPAAAPTATGSTTIPKSK
jgi:hypothetical protein